MKQLTKILSLIIFFACKSAVGAEQVDIDIALQEAVLLNQASNVAQFLRAGADSNKE